MVHTNKDVNNISKLYFESTQKEELTRKVSADGTIRFFNKDNQLHNPYGPALIVPDTKAGNMVISGYKSWYINGERHREDGPAMIYNSGVQLWFKHGKKHRLNEPAVIYSKTQQEWWVDGKLHREDGPAKIDKYGIKTYFIDGISLTKREFDEFVKKKKFREEIQARADTVFDDDFLKELD